MNKLRLILSVALISFCGLIFAQDINEAGEAFNNGNSFIKAKKYALAIQEFNNCIEICTEVGDDAFELSQKAKSALSIAYMGLGKSQYKAKKFDEAIDAFKMSAEYETSDEKKGIVNKYIARVNYTKATAYYKANKFDEAVELFNKSYAMDETYIKALYGKLLLYRKQDNVEMFKQTVDQILEVGPAHDKKTVAKSANLANEFFTAEGGKAIQKGNFKRAVELLEQGFGYGREKAQIYYFAAIAYNGLSQWNKAIECGNKALPLEKKSKSNINFELGKAYQGIGNKAKALATFKKVVDGPNAEAAKYKINQELK